jgi:peroxiredoxin
MPGIGDQAPDFSVPDQHGNTFTLSQFKGAKNVVLSFHIFSFTGG